MKELTNKVTEIRKANAEGFVSFFDLFKTVVENNGNKGLTVADIRDRLKVLDALTGDTVSLEDSVFNTLITCWDAMPWGAVHKDIVAADDYLKSVK